MRRTPSDHFNGKRFVQPGPMTERGLWAVLRWQWTRRAALWPKRVPVEPAVLPPAPTGDGLVVTWIGHSSFLIRSQRTAWVTDPVFSERIGPIQGLGPRRVAPPALSPSTLPPLDGILVSHDHYDHCDLPSLRALARSEPGRRRPAAITPLNYGGLLQPFQSAAKLIELDWWDIWNGPADSTVELVPAKHWCRRRIGGYNERLWGGFYLRAGNRTLWFVGDSGFDERLFAQIRQRAGPPDVALIPIGAYEPRWFMREAHMNPEEAVATHQVIGARRSVAMHWGAFQLTDEARDAPPQALGIALRNAGLDPESFVVLPIGGSLSV